MRNLHICCQGDRIYRLIFRSIDAAAKQVNDMNEAEDFVHDGVAVTSVIRQPCRCWGLVEVALKFRFKVSCSQCHRTHGDENRILFLERFPGFS